MEQKKVLMVVNPRAGKNKPMDSLFHAAALYFFKGLSVDKDPACCHCDPFRFLFIAYVYHFRPSGFIEMCKI